MASSMLRLGASAPCRSCSRTLRSRRAGRLSIARSQTENTTPGTSGTVFFAGKTYTEAEWKEAVNKGAISTTQAAGSDNAVTSPFLDNLVEIMAFSGPGPEIINGRLAMLGVVTALAAELGSGTTVIQQWASATTPISLTFLLIIGASLVPLITGRKGDAFGPFKAEAEMLNGRAAMIGFASLLVIELVKGSPLF